jgi:hypothetical protein
MHFRGCVRAPVVIWLLWGTASAYMLCLWTMQAVQCATAATAAGADADALTQWATASLVGLLVQSNPC